MVDNHSGDAIFISAARTRQGLIPAIHAPGANGTLWRTDVWLSNPGATAEDVVVNQRSLRVPARGAVVIRDVLGSDGSARLSINTAIVLATSRTYTVGTNGSFGQFVPPGSASSALGTLIGIESSPSFRTNIGAMSQRPSTVRFIAYDAGGREVWRSDVAVNGLAQFPLPVPLRDGRVSAEVLDGGPVVPYASVVDNVSGDPIFITAQY
jgi:hypothetical protein